MYNSCGEPCDAGKLGSIAQTQRRDGEPNSEDALMVARSTPYVMSRRNLCVDENAIGVDSHTFTARFTFRNMGAYSFE